MSTVLVEEERHSAAAATASPGPLPRVQQSGIESSLYPSSSSSVSDSTSKWCTPDTLPCDWQKLKGITSLDDKNVPQCHSSLLVNQAEISSNYHRTSTASGGGGRIEASNQHQSLITANAVVETAAAEAGGDNCVSITGAALVMGKPNNNNNNNSDSNLQSTTPTTNHSQHPQQHHNNNHSMSTVAVPNSIGGNTLANITNHHSANNLTPSLVSGRCGPSMIDYKNLRFLITDKPTDATLTQYIEELQRRKVTDVVRVCESTYSSKRLELAGIKCHDWAFDDGTPPPPKIINDWLSLIIERFKDQQASGGSGESRNNSTAGGGGASRSPDHSSKPCIAVHCVAGLGRAPVLVAVALIEAGMKYEDAVDMIRDVRRGAINAKQLQYLSQYKPKKVLHFSNGLNSKRKFCCIA